jgi:serine/threonine-protein kinase
MTGEEGQQVTKTGLVVGTPEYMSPEQLSGDKLDGRSDIYSLALVFYRMVTGTFPFQAESTQEMMIKRLTDEPLPMAAANPALAVPPALEAAMRRALGRMPSERYASAVEFANDVARAVEGMGGAPQAEVTEAATQIISAAGPVADVTAQIAPTRVRGAAAAPTRPPTPSTPTTPRPKPSPPPPPVRKKAPVAAIAAVVVVLGGGGAAAALLLGKGGGAPPAGDTSSVALRDTPQTATPGPTGTDRGGTRPSGTPRDTQGGGPAHPAGGGEVAPPPTVDLGRVNANILAVGANVGEDAADPATRQRAMQELQTIYNNIGLPDSLRAKAASYIAEGYEYAKVIDQACTWIGHAVELDPSKRGYAAYRQALGCTS